MARMGECLVVFPLQVGLSDLQVLEGHLRADVAEQSHERGKADAGAEHFCGIGVAILMRDEVASDSDSSDGIAEGGTEAANQRLTGAISR